MKPMLPIIAIVVVSGCDGHFNETGDSDEDGHIGPDLDLASGEDAPVGEEDEVYHDWVLDRDVSSDVQEEEESVEAPPSYSFVVFGDNQFATESCTSGVPERLAVPEEILSLAPTFILHTGDLVDHGADAGAYDAFTSCYGSMLAAIPFFPTIGNHDADYSNGMPNYKSYLERQLFIDNPTAYGAGYDADFFIIYEDDPTEYSTDFNDPSHLDVLPSGYSFKTFYAFKYANAYFISFEQGTRWRTCTPIPWVETHLSSARSDPSIQHVFVTMHHPMFSTTMAETSDGECLEPVRRHYEELFRQYDVTMVFSGHVHLYDRFLVPDDGSYTRSRPPPDSYGHDGEAVHYIVTGGGGGPLPGGCDPIPAERDELSANYSQARGCGYHVTLVEVEGEALNVSVVGVEGSSDSFTTSVWDSFTID